MLDRAGLLRKLQKFPISRDPPEGGTLPKHFRGITENILVSFQFLGIPPKGELGALSKSRKTLHESFVSNF